MPATNILVPVHALMTKVLKNKALRISFPLYMFSAHSFIFGHSFYFCHSFIFGSQLLFFPQLYFWPQLQLVVFVTAVFSVHNDTALFLPTTFIFTTALLLATMTQLYFWPQPLFSPQLYFWPQLLFFATISSAIFSAHSFIFCHRLLFSPQL